MTTPNIRLLPKVLAIVLIGASLAMQAGEAQTPMATHVAPPADTVAAEITLKVDLTGLSPLARAAGMSCWGAPIGGTDAVQSARAKQQTREQVKDLESLISSYARQPTADGSAGVQTAIERLRKSLSQRFADMGLPLVDVPHYYGAEANVPLALQSGEYHGSVTATVKFPPVLLAEPKTRRPLLAPEALVVCWLNINGRPAAYGPALQAATAANANQVLASSTIHFISMAPLPGL